MYTSGESVEYMVENASAMGEIRGKKEGYGISPS